jgi:prepilin-type N-terminal cleavage/methylation domain-containing protein
MKINKKYLPGFTLIELLLVIVILGIIIVIALAVINPVRLQRRSREAVMLAQASKVCAALFACSATASTFADCDEAALADLDVNSPAGNPTGSTYAIAGSTTLTMTATLPFVAGGKVLNTPCTVTCSYDFSTGVSVPATKSAANCY